MAKKIRFPLEMDNGVEVRSMEELRNNFSLGKVLEYVQNEKLVAWLRDRYENSIADAVAALDKMDAELPKKVSAIFDIPYDEKTADDLKKTAERAERIKQLKEFTDEKQFVDEIDKVAFDQDELYDLLDEEVNEIYLCGDRFAIPLSVIGVSYKGINNPVVVIDSKTEIDWLEKKIILEAVRFDEKYQAVVDSANATKEVLYEKLVATVKKQATKNASIGKAPDKTILSFMVPMSEREAANRMYATAKEAISNLSYDEDADILGMKKLVYENDLIGIANRYLSEL
jgi:hypothetical protein